MSIYNIGGQQLNSAYRVSSESLSTAYTKDSNLIFGTPVSFSIMTYNPGAWYGWGAVVPSNVASSWYEMLSSIFDKYKPDFVGIQEYYSAIGSYSAENMIKENDPYFYAVDRTSNCAGRAFASKYEIITPSDNLFSHQDGGELRYYLKGYIYVEGRKVCIISAHTSYQGSYPYTQCNELLDVIANEDYFIVVGDMNLRVDTIGSADYNNLNGVWINAGYNSVSGPEFGIQKTYYDNGSGWHGVDQIFTSANISIDSVVIDDTKTDEYASLVGERFDHVPLIAYVTINDALLSVTSINATYTQSKTIYETNDLNDLTSDLVVTATWSNSSTTIVPVNNYTLSGTLTPGTSTITVTYQGNTTTFNVSVTAYTWLYKASSGQLLSAQNYVSKVTGGSGGTETLDNSKLVLTTTIGTPQNYIRYSFADTTTTSAKIRIKAYMPGMVVGGVAPSIYAGLRLQLSNGTNGGQAYFSDENGLITAIYMEGTTLKTVNTSFSTSKYHVFELEYANGHQKLFIDDSLIFDTTTLSSNYCTANAIFNQAQRDVYMPNGCEAHIEWVGYLESA